MLVGVRPRAMNRRVVRACSPYTGGVMMETPDFSLWIVVILFALILILLWGSLFLFLALATWIIARTRMKDVDKPARRDWDD